MLQGVNFITKKFAQILVEPIRPSRNTFFIHTSSYKNARFWRVHPPNCNNRTKAYGILRVWKDAAPKIDLELSDDDEDELQVVVPKFDIGDDDICAGFAAV
jgi:hypothetical protein